MRLFAPENRSLQNSMTQGNLNLIVNGWVCQVFYLFGWHSRPMTFVRECILSKKDIKLCNKKIARKQKIFGLIVPWIKRKRPTS